MVLVAMFQLEKLLIRPLRYRSCSGRTSTFECLDLVSTRSRLGDLRASLGVNMLSARIGSVPVTSDIDTDDTSLTPQLAKPPRVVANLCSGGSCPTIYETDQGTLIVQGYKTLDDTGVEVPEGEALVEIPLELLAEALKALG
jgi:hypothetical protein